VVGEATGLTANSGATAQGGLVPEPVSGRSDISTRHALHKHRSYIDCSFASVSALTVTRLHQHGCSSFTPQ
jgi:hypothetical protein